MGSVGAGNTVSDCDPLEIERGISLNLTPCILEWNDCKINWIDTPGAEDLYGDVECALDAADAAILLIDGENGVQGGSEKLWEILNRRGMPRAVVVNRLDNEQADYQKALGTVADILETAPTALNLPIGTGAAFQGVADLAQNQAYLYDGANASRAEIPGDLAGLAEEMRAELVESAAEADEELLEKYFEEDDLSSEDILKGLRAGFADGSVAPAFAVSAEKSGRRPVAPQLHRRCVPLPRRQAVLRGNRRRRRGTANRQRRPPRRPDIQNDLRSVRRAALPLQSLFRLRRRGNGVQRLEKRQRTDRKSTLPAAERKTSKPMPSPPATSERSQN